MIINYYLKYFSKYLIEEDQKNIRKKLIKYIN